MKISEIKKHLRSYDEWIDYEKNESSSPIDFEIRQENQVLYFFAGNHSSDPNDPQFGRLDDYFKKFIKETKGRKIAFVTEQSFDKAKLTSKEQSIKDFVGEMGYSLFLAKENNIKTFNFEPKEKQIIDELLKDFEKDYIFYYDFAHWIYWWNRGGRNGDFNEKAKKTEISIKKSFKWKNFDFSLDNFKEIHKKYFKNDVDVEDQDFFYSITKPTIDDTPFNLVSRTESEIRDSFIVKGILGLWEEGYSLFVVYGLGHAFVQKPALKKLFLKPELSMV